MTSVKADVFGKVGDGDGIIEPGLEPGDAFTGTVVIDSSVQGEFGIYDNAVRRVEFRFESGMDSHELVS